VEPVLATFLLSLAVLLVGGALGVIALCCHKNPEATKQIFPVIGVLFGLLAAGGLGTLFANQAAQSAENAAESAGTAAATQTVKEVEKMEPNDENGGGKSSK
jgi:hypothetical protein